MLSLSCTLIISSAARSVPVSSLFDAARFTSRYVRAVGQDVSPGECVLLSTSKSVRRAMKLWDISGDGKFWKVQLDIRDLGGHHDFTGRARAGTLSHRVGMLLLVSLLLVRYLWVFRSSWAWLGVSIFLLVFMLLKLRTFPLPQLVLSALLL